VVSYHKIKVCVLIKNYFCCLEFLFCVVGLDCTYFISELVLFYSNFFLCIFVAPMLWQYSAGAKINFYLLH
jgi:hypothetical protein